MLSRKSILLASLLLASHGSATAVSLSADSVSACLGLSTCTVASATLAATPAPGAVIAEQGFLGLRGIGVAFSEVGNPLRRPEIQGDSFMGLIEGLTISFAVPQLVSSIGIGHLQNPDLFPTDAQEIASITAFGSLGSATLTLQSIKSTGDLGEGFLVNDSSLFSELLRLDTNTGEFVIHDPFERLGPINRIVFSSPDTPTPAGDNSDFSVTLVQTAAIPEPSTAWLMLPGALALGVLARRAKKSA